MMCWPISLRCALDRLHESRIAELSGESLGTIAPELRPTERSGMEFAAVAEGRVLPQSTLADLVPPDALDEPTEILSQLRGVLTDQDQPSSDKTAAAVLIAMIEGYRRARSTREA